MKLILPLFLLLASPTWALLPYAGDSSMPFFLNISSNTAVGIQGNAWNNVAVAINGVSAVIDCQNVSYLSIFGNESVQSNINVQVSIDNVNFYTILSIPGPNAGGNFGANLTIGARYVRLQAVKAATITATIAAKH